MITAGGNRTYMASDIMISFLEYIWAFLLVMNGNSVYNANALKDYHLLPLCVAMTAILLLVCVALGKVRILKKTALFAIFIFFYCSFYLFVQSANMNVTNYAYLFCLGLPLLYILFLELHRQNGLLSLFHRLENMILVFLVMSLFFWLLGTALHVITPNMTTRINWGVFDKVKGYWGLHFDIQIDTTFGISIYRNSGIFTEGPMLNLWACIALGIELFLKDKHSRFKLFICAAAILTSMSTTGILFIGLCIFLIAMGDATGTKRIRVFLKLVFIFVAIPAGIYGVLQVFQLKMETASFAMRMSDYVGPLALWAKYPIFGSGYAGLRSLQDFIFTTQGQLGFSNSVVAVLATGGIWIALLFYIPHIGTMISAFTKNKQISRFCVCYFFLFFTTAFFARYIAVVMVAFGMAILSRTGGNVRHSADARG